MESARDEFKTSNFYPETAAQCNSGYYFVGRDGDLGRGFGAETLLVRRNLFQYLPDRISEIMTDPSYAGQIITFTFPHIGNVGVNDEDIESVHPAVRHDCSRRCDRAFKLRSTQHLDAWLKSHAIPAICGIDTRALTRRIRDLGAPERHSGGQSQGESSTSLPCRLKLRRGVVWTVLILPRM